MIAAHLLLLSVWAVAGEFVGHHLLHYAYTGVSDPASGLPVFSIVQFLDDQITTQYNTDIEETRVGVPWIDTEDLEMWGHLLYQHKEWWKLAFKHNVKTAMNRFRQSGGLHVIQLMYGCELSSDNSSRLYYRFGYDGRDFITLETDRWVFAPNVYEAEISTQRWNSEEDGAGQRWKNILEVSCIELLKKYVDRGREELERKVAPEVKISARQSSGVTSLYCWVFGFYPRGVDVRWVRDGQDVIPYDETTPILPNPDGTYQVVITAKVSSGHEGSYSCHINHGSLVEELVVPWEPKVKRSRIIPLVLIPSFVVAFIIYFVFWKNPCVPSTRSILWPTPPSMEKPG